MINLMTLVTDFVYSAKTIDGYGCLKGDELAVYYASGLSKAQIKKFKKYGIVPVRLQITSQVHQST